MFGAGLVIRPDHSSERGSKGLSLKFLPTDVLDAERLDLEQVGEDKTCGEK